MELDGWALSRARSPAYASGIGKVVLVNPMPIRFTEQIFLRAVNN